MKTAIVYASVHHGNTKKIIDEIAKTNDVELIDATQTVEKDLSEYDLIGFASGVYGGKFHQSVLKFASVNLTDNKNIFLIWAFKDTFSKFFCYFLYDVHYRTCVCVYKYLHYLSRYLNMFIWPSHS